MVVAIDTYAAIQDLKAAGIKPEHAEAIVRTVSQSGDDPATWSKLAALRADLRADLAQLGQRATMRTVTTVAVSNAILFTALRDLPPAA